LSDTLNKTQYLVNTTEAAELLSLSSFIHSKRNRWSRLLIEMTNQTW